jgi:hypothetical protein
MHRHGAGVFIPPLAGGMPGPEGPAGPMPPDLVRVRGWTGHAVLPPASRAVPLSLLAETEPGWPA